MKMVASWSSVCAAVLETYMKFTSGEENHRLGEEPGKIAVFFVVAFKTGQGLSQELTATILKEQCCMLNVKLSI